VPVAAQGSDGSTLEDSQSEFTVEGYLLIVAVTELGVHARSSPRVDRIEYVDGEFDITE
jgi:hypothetical protein